MVIYKFNVGLEFKGKFTVSIPKGSKFLSMALQGNEAVMWWMVNPDEPWVNREFAVYGTGFKIEEDLGLLHFLGTIQFGIFVFHVFEVLANKWDGNAS